MSTPASVKPNLAAAATAPQTARQANQSSTEATHATETTDSTAQTATDLEPSVQDESDVPTDTKAADAHPSTEAKGIIAKASHDISNSPASQAPPLFGAVTSTQPIPTVYPPRRANIFKTRTKNLRYPDAAYNPVGPNASSSDLEKADGFDGPDMDQFQAEVRETMKRKTEMFMRNMSQHNWTKRRVEDLGELFAIEED
ncbi:hypothetical protein B0T20DRAFT_487252 [Sordaria brevicollis]|uniref:Uncharacterized protein n=1 Tax=Sordaria brevicollis TaxID=83679 RepID=A0AAE0P9I1_SORBR|nr:hypothetical protein B0T20DRAFT_487252 [Sordaria brevicollis]